MWRSEPQIPLASTRTSASSAAPTSGSGFSSTRTSPGAWKVTARIGAEPYRRPRRQAAQTLTPATWKRLASPSGLAVSAIRDSSASSFSKSAASPCWKETSLPSSSSMKISTKRGVELFAGDPAQLDDRVVAGHRRAVGVARGHHVVGVGDGDDPRQLGDFVALEAARIAFAVDPLVVGEDDLRDRAVAVERGDDAGALLRVALDQHPVLVGERHVGLEDPVGEDELADVVQQRGDVDELLLLAREAGPLGDRPRVARHRGGVAGGHLVPQVERAQQRAQHPDLEAGQLLAAHLQLLGPLLGQEQGAEQVLEGDQDDAEEGDAGEADLDVDEGDADGHQRRRELRGKQRDQHRAELAR